MVFGTDGDLYVSSFYSDEVHRYEHGFAPETAFTVSLSSPSPLTVMVDFNTADGTAFAGFDYTDTTGTVTFAPGVTTRTIHIPTLDDAIEEDTETFFVNLSAATGAVILDNQGKATIFDDDGAGVMVTGVSPNFANPNEQKTVTVTGSGFVDGATVDFGNKVNVQSITFDSTTQLTVQIKVHRRAADGPRDVTVTNPDSSTDVLVGGFFVGTLIATSSQSSGPAQSFNLSGNDESSTETSLVQPTDPTLLLVEPVLIEEESDDESSTQDDPAILPIDQADLDSLFGDLDGSLQEELLAV
jgi:chitinase